MPTRLRRAQLRNDPITECVTQFAGRARQLGCLGRRLLEQAIDRLGFSARAYHRILKVARTIADLAAEEMIRPAHVAEAVRYRCLDRGGALS